ncbi:MAG: 3-isopropylmalate dehydratase small subunit, partial [Sphingobacteriales bacterium]|nr:3-isopropylmalate dehydratase small subunit [Sphingobacteriales bacterium]
ITIQSTAVPLNMEDVDTDQIIPARFLKATTREGFGDNLFRDWRYNNANTLKEAFVLNNPAYSGRFWLSVKTSSCGSSREDVAWQFTIMVSKWWCRVSLQISLKNNALNNGLLPVVVFRGIFAENFCGNRRNPATELKIDLEKQQIEILTTQDKETFDINPYKKTCMINGYDDIDFLLSLKDKIEAFELK